MIYVGIDIAKDKHDCFIANLDGEILFPAFPIPNNLDGFLDLYQKICSVSDDFSKVKVGLEATGHYSYNLLGFLVDKGLPTFVINPLHTNLYRKSLSLRQTKTDKVDARTIALMMSEFPSAASVASAHLTRLTHLLEVASKGRYGKDTAILFRETARKSIGSHMPVKSMELKHTIRLTRELSTEIDEIEQEIQYFPRYEKAGSCHLPITKIRTGIHQGSLDFQISYLRI